jgi:hypothetical protein
VYKDSRGIPTIGIGFNLQVGGAKLAISNVGADYDKVLSGAQCLTDSQIMQLFEPSYEAAVYGAKGVVSSFNSLCCEVQAVMTDMAYNLGSHGQSLSPACTAPENRRCLRVSHAFPSNGTLCFSPMELYVSLQWNSMLLCNLTLFRKVCVAYVHAVRCWACVLVCVILML